MIFIYNIYLSMAKKQKGGLVNNLLGSFVAHVKGATNKSNTINDADILKALGLTNPPYSVYQKITVSGGNVGADADNTSFKIQRKDKNGTHILTKKELEDLIGKGKTLNGIAVVAQEGIQITKKKEFFKKLETLNAVAGNFGDVSSLMTDFESGMPGMNYDVTGFEGKDEEIVQKILFAYSNLIKEIYEFEGYGFGVQ